MPRERAGGRGKDQIRPLKILRGVLKFAEGSALITLGDTKVLCAATVEENVPPFLKGSGKGWIRAEYAMLPRATQERSPRERSFAGRAQEIQRFIGRALRAVVDLEALGERTIVMDCDVIQADGGTRAAAVTGGFVALYDALRKLLEQGLIERFPVRDFVAAISVGVVEDEFLLDLDYSEDSRARVDLNLVMTGGGNLVELQGAGEEGPFTFEELFQLIELGKKGIKELIEVQKRVIHEGIASGDQ
jgi:ribonuclease PH